MQTCMYVYKESDLECCSKDLYGHILILNISTKLFTER